MRAWEDNVPLMRAGYHKKLRSLAYGKSVCVYPPQELVFHALELVPFNKVRVVIIGQDPYINEHNGIPEAHGLCFSVKEGIPAPPSLKNIFKEIQNSTHNNTTEEQSTDLSRWSRQGVLLLNASLTVIAKKPNSHADLGWQELTDNIIESLSQKNEHIVFMLWGAFAQKKEALIDGSRHKIIKTSHPSPLSAYRGFLGSNVFNECNNYLKSHKSTPIDW